MKILAVDDERIALEGLLDSIRAAAPEAEVYGFRYPEDALAFAEKERCVAAFLDIELTGLSGVELARRLKALDPDVNIIFTTGYREYQGTAFELHASGYVMKPVTPERVRRELADLRRPMREDSAKQVWVQTFGNFEVRLDGKPVEFRYNRTRELLAYLVDRRGALCTFPELRSVLFEDDGHENYLKSLRKDLLDTLEAAGCGDVIVQQRGKLGVDPEKLICDYYDWCSGKRTPFSTYRGEYMEQYSWGEYTKGALEMSGKRERR